MFGKSWDLKPMMTYWMYITMTNCLLRCPDVVAENKKGMRERTQLQRTACIGITVAFWTTPTAALIVSIDLTPLTFRIEDSPELVTSESAALVMLPKEVTLRI